MLEICSNYKTKIVMLDKTKQKPNILFKKKPHLKHMDIEREKV